MRAETYVREPEPEDLPFIYSSWLKSLQPSLSMIDKSIFFKYHKRLIDSILRRSQVIISVNPNELGQIFGYAVFEHVHNRVMILHFVYAKHTYRRLGIATELYHLVAGMRKDHDNPCVASHTSAAMRDFLNHWDLVFNPYVLLQEGYEK